MASKGLAWTESLALFAALYVGLPWIALTVDRWIGWPGLPWPVPTAGIPLLVIGGAGLVRCFFLFVREGEGTPNPLVPPRRLVTSGPFAWTRNPIVLSHALASLGVALLVGSSTAILLVLLLGIPVQMVSRLEERTLETRFGDAYRAYKEAVPRWLPRRPRQSR
ncbi:MAG TPA: isoprenylcysteine carboxylmethyltransferase family protein [Thermoplasmata archaeon]|jgi:protein-S-isoprenylcysteine O-methyltransferase Ste14